MAERRIIVDNLILQYEGIFELQQLYLVIDKWIRQRHYDKFEKRNHEHVLKDPQPIIQFQNFGESSLDFNLTFWINSQSLSNVENFNGIALSKAYN